jgi:high-affinity Fe2+/Pb2+ permease
MRGPEQILLDAIILLTCAGALAIVIYRLLSVT